MLRGSLVKKLLNKFNLYFFIYNGKTIFRANWFSGVSPNPYLSFYFKAEKSGLIEVEWEDDYSKSTFKRGYLKVLDKNGNEILPVSHSI